MNYNLIRAAASTLTPVERGMVIEGLELLAVSLLREARRQENLPRKDKLVACEQVVGRMTDAVIEAQGGYRW